MSRKFTFKEKCTLVYRTVKFAAMASILPLMGPIVGVSLLIGPINNYGVMGTWDILFNSLMSEIMPLPYIFVPYIIVVLGCIYIGYGIEKNCIWAERSIIRSE